MGSDWASLPDHLLDSILERLELVWDYLQFSLVCWSWNYIAKESTVKAKMMSRYNRPPMLLISSSTNKGNNTWNVYDIRSNKVLDMQLEVPNKRFCGSSKGWLIAVEENFAVTLINPFFRVKGTRNKENSIINLPPMNTECTGSIHWATQVEDYAYRATISADPILNANECIVAVIYEDICQLAFIRLSQDTQWTYIDQSWFPFDDVAIVQETCYAVLANSGALLSFDITNSKTKKKKSENFYSDIECVAPLVNRKQHHLTRIVKYIVHSNDEELLMVARYGSVGPNRKTWKFEVFQMDFDKYRWKRRKTLGDIAIFLGDHSAVSVVASHFPGCQPNCIYFNHDNDRCCSNHEVSGSHDFGVYNMEDNQCHVGFYNVQDRNYSNLSTLLKRTNRPPIWVVPTLQM